jgi:hypothetical protein
VSLSAKSSGAFAYCPRLLAFKHAADLFDVFSPEAQDNPELVVFCILLLTAPNGIVSQEILTKNQAFQAFLVQEP